MRLVQVVYNFISNAIKHAPGSEPIEVSLRTRSDGGRKWGRVEVRDFGPGVPEQVRSDLFVRVMHPAAHDSRTARSGMGLGLFISARIIEQHVGRIGIDAEKPGTKVWFELPISAAEPARVERSTT